MPTTATDHRGRLIAAEFERELPFVPMRVFIVDKAPVGTTRGGHAHRSCHQFLIAVSGEIFVEWYEGHEAHSMVLTPGLGGLHIPPLIWALQTYRSNDAVLLVLASDAYDAADYIDDRAEAQRLATNVTFGTAAIAEGDLLN